MHFERPAVHLLCLLFCFFALLPPQDVCDKAEHIARCALGDLFLDTPVCNAHTTATDALWSGIPLLTLPGMSQASRVAASILTAAGVPELVAHCATDYERMAVEFAQVSPQGVGASDGSAPFLGNNRLARLRRRIARARSSPLFDTTRWVRNTEALYWAAWERYSCGLPPASIEGVDVCSALPTSVT